MQASARALLADLEMPKPENVIKVHTDKTLEKLLPKAFKLYEKYLSKYEYDWPIELAGDKKKIWNYCAGIKFTPTPNLIFEFALRIAEYQNRQGFGWVTGQYISALIIRSHAHGNNNFNLELRHLDTKINYLLGFTGIEERPLRVSVSGNVGNFCGLDAQTLRLTLRGNAAGQLAMKAKDSRFKIFGETDLGAGWCASNSVFKCTDRESAERIKQVVREGCRVYWLNNKKRVLIK
ncbi:MAG: hypothetical protein HY438_02850 [DPANN group archaeon]|nr:hypothetical protein [DPANN group archaeon]